MGLDMNMYATLDDTLTMEKLYEEDYQDHTGLSWYWRKANQIHGWFVKNVQNDNDDCGLYEVSIGQIKKLRDEVNFTLATKNTAGLPPTTGFFFGSSAVDEWYWEDLADTKRYLGEMLDLYDSDPETKFYYTSSW
jgi:hypothetical protein